MPLPGGSLWGLMRNLPLLLLLSSVLIEGGCRRHEAAKPPRRSSAWAAEPAGTPSENGPPQIPEKVEVTIEEVEELNQATAGLEKTEPPDQAANEPSPRGRSERLILLALKIRVTSHYHDVKLLVGPQVFYLETEKGLRILPRSSKRKKPPLASTYLKGASSSTSGWLIFSVPWDAKGLTLKSCMNRPPLEVPVLW